MLTELRFIVTGTHPHQYDIIVLAHTEKLLNVCINPAYIIHAFGDLMHHLIWFTCSLDWTSVPHGKHVKPGRIMDGRPGRVSVTRTSSSSAYKKKSTAGLGLHKVGDLS